MHNAIANDLVAPREGVASWDVTGYDFPEDVMPVRGRGLRVQFFYDLSTIHDPGNPVMHGKRQKVLCVAKQPIGDRYTMSVQRITEDQAKREFPREYKMFLELDEIPEEGTPLRELPGLTASQIAALTVYGLRSVEDLLAVDESRLNDAGMDAIRARKIAERWDERQKGSAEDINAADIEARYKTALDEALQRSKKQAEQIEALTARLEALASVTGNGAASPSTPQMVQPAEDVVPDEDPTYDPFMEGEAVADGPLSDPLKDE